MTGIGHFARATPDAAAIVTTKGALSFADLDDRQRRVVGSLRAAGVRPRDRVGVLSFNRAEVLEVTIGCLRAGIVPVPVNPLLTDPEIAYIVEDSGARSLFADRPFEHPNLAGVITFGDAYERDLAEAKPARLADVVLGRPMHYTSGTTGTTKGVWVTPEDEASAVRRSTAFRELWALEPDDVHLVVSPLAHSAPHRFATRTLESGGRVVLLQGRFDAEETMVAIELFGITTTFMVPTHLERILALDRALGGRDASSLRLLAHAGAPIREDTKRAALEVFPPGSLWEFYGSTEGQATRISPDEWLRKPGSVGTPLPGVRISIAGPEGEAQPGEPGEVWVEDPGAERFEYWGDRTKTEAAWRGGAFSVGDLGYLDADGYLYLTGRKHDTIITGGVNVYPQEVESVLAQHPAVTEVVVFGVPHPEWGEEVHARVVPAPHMPLDPERLRRWARERLAGYKCPRRIELVSDLEHTATGKIVRPRPGDVPDHG
ncbi:MAG TPA: AMP-binding protein [Actinomycetota bacterium]|nr:AMP-binding protein [Actinomycetota bacterium]